MMSPRRSCFRISRPSGIYCPDCGGPTRVIDKRDRRDGRVWRRHQCILCNARHTSYERLALAKVS